MTLEKVMYTAHTTATGGRDGVVRSDDGKLDVRLDPPKQMGGNDAAIDSKVSLGPLGAAEKGFGIAVEMLVHLPGVERTTAQELIEETHKVCPYSNATRGNIDVNISLA